MVKPQEIALVSYGVERVTEKEKKEKVNIEEPRKVGADTIVRAGIIEETVVSASNVSDVQKGLVTGSGVAQAIKKIEQGKGSSQQSTESSQQEEKK